MTPDGLHPGRVQAPGLAEAQAMHQQLLDGTLPHGKVPEALLRPMDGAMRSLREATIGLDDLRTHVELDRLAEKLEDELIYRTIKVRDKDLVAALARRNAELQSPERRKRRVKLADLTPRQKQDLVKSIKVERGAKRRAKLVQQLRRQWGVDQGAVRGAPPAAAPAEPARLRLGQ